MSNWKSFKRGRRTFVGTLGYICSRMFVFPVQYRFHGLISKHLDSTSTTFQPFFLDFAKAHSLATHFFIRMWGESGAAADDFTRVAALVRSQCVGVIFCESFSNADHDNVTG